ncbi:hypothetical protein [Actinoplanes friuliensis]|uniref:Collagen alpha-5(VI) chain n=1 Tax=Actinoplanes friuliensis DSM 7358 TaxID=1246995 RepID=U5VVU6_9ACTN|nr:hypothetical protein [Actinoplanes friuliensis]AGZ39845.1 Collagen alpha-5(VI) chain [Actinoplanes friuliensis DSM 7358]
MTRSRRAGLSRDEARQQPLYARMLGLQYLAPGGFLCFVFLEGAVALGILLALAELVSWWGVLVLPLTVAVMVKLNDVVAGSLIRTPATPPAERQAKPRGSKTVRLPASVIAAARAEAPALRPAALRPQTAAVPGGPIGDQWTPPPMGAIDANALNGPPVARQRAEQLDEPQQRARQSAARRYE